MSKIRINELARELEVKPNRILELLPEFAVEEKKTHSSSIDEDVAIAIKKKLGLAFDSDVSLRAERDNYRAVALAEGPDHDADDNADVTPVVAKAPAPESRENGAEKSAPPRPQAEETPAQVIEPEVQKPVAAASRPSPLRPPLASGPLRPPTMHHGASPAPPAPPAAAAPPAPAVPV